MPTTTPKNPWPWRGFRPLPADTTLLEHDREVPGSASRPCSRQFHASSDKRGRIAEHDNTGAVIREYIWLDGRPLAVVEGGQTYQLHWDQIGRPVMATGATGAVVWAASYLPFGGIDQVYVDTLALEQNLRFPGQWFQAETGLHQNWHRDYDPTTGRYLQADPLGLVDGPSVYGYARQSPVRYTDPRGEAACGGVCVGAGIVLGGYRVYKWVRTLLPIVRSAPAVMLPVVAVASIEEFQKTRVRDGSDRAIPKPKKRRGRWTCFARADADQTSSTYCKIGNQVGWGVGVANDQGPARNLAKAMAVSDLGQTTHHVSCKCTGPKGEPYSGGC